MIPGSLHTLLNYKDIVKLCIDSEDYYLQASCDSGFGSTFELKFYVFSNLKNWAEIL